ncbi:MAG: GNAT family N-acetyltransferase [Gammaproteobacteria bacterium]|nr:MAG: GNAT family N-acetyltransferase [Gammaproteobacteria bacterium]
MVAIRDANPDDLEVICEFNACMAAETENRALDLECLHAGVLRVLNDPGRGRYFLAEVDGRVVAQTSVTFEWSDWRNGWFWWLQSVYVRLEVRGTGVFRTLLEHIESRARAAGDVRGIRLYVDSDNKEAARAYDRLGLPVSSYLMREKHFVTARGSRALC